MLSEKFLRKCICQALMLLLLSRTSSILVKGLCLIQLLSDILLHFHKEHSARRTRVPTETHTHRRAIRQSRSAQTLLMRTSTEGDRHCSPPVNAKRREKMALPTPVKNGSTKPTCRSRLRKLCRHVSNLFLGCCRGSAEKL